MADRVLHLFWDFDGTMYDSYPQIARAMRLALADYGVAEREDALSALLRTTVWQVVEAYAPRAGVGVDELMDVFHRHQDAEGGFPPFEGLADCLRELKAAGCSHYLYTHRDRRAVRELMKDGLWDCFTDAVTREDGYPDKPAPDALEALMARYRAKPRACAMIGDRDIDVLAGRNAGMRTILFDPGGYFPTLSADARARSMREIRDIVLGM